MAVRVAFDTSFLLLLLDANAAGPIDPSTSKQLEGSKDRVELLIQNLSSSKAKAIIPTPVLAEVLVEAGSTAPNYLHVISSSSAMQIANFDVRCAVELAELERAIWGPPRPTPQSSRQKVKVDRQIVSVAKVYGATILYTDDHDMLSLAKGAGIRVVRSWELPMPPIPDQTRFDF